MENRDIKRRRFGPAVTENGDQKKTHEEKSRGKY